MRTGERLFYAINIRGFRAMVASGFRVTRDVPLHFDHPALLRALRVLRLVFDMELMIPPLPGHPENDRAARS
jgi:hypothetical protein